MSQQTHILGETTAVSSKINNTSEEEPKMMASLAKANSIEIMGRAPETQFP